jgi:D-beta-D-heptose 7-phosphate kinase/D-beta-D-heptose 1-phosphate adenosyltransferase
MDTQQQEYYNIDLIGDSCEDVYHYGTCHRLSPEAPVPILKESNSFSMKGMSWNVRLNLESFGLFVVHYTNEEKIRKHRFIDKRYNQHLLRWDEGEEKKLKPFNLNLISANKVPNAVVISDYNKGFLPSEMCKRIVSHYRSIDPAIPIFVDTKKTDLSCFEGCYIKINEKEYSNIESRPRGSKFIVTLGERGAKYQDSIYPTETVEVFDVCGAGDVFLSSLVYGFLKHEDMRKAIRIANKLASISVSHMGTYVLTPEDIKWIEE